MSELKARGVDDVYIEYYNTGKHELAQVYLKSEADKVIAERKEKYNELAKLYDKAIQACCDADKVIAHHKYKRCLAMAKWCYAKWDDTATKYYKSVWYRKWEVKWLALAEKFKEAK